MKEIVILAGNKDPEKGLLTLLTSLFPDCEIRIVYSGNDSVEACNCRRKIFKEMVKAV